MKRKRSLVLRKNDVSSRNKRRRSSKSLNEERGLKSSDNKRKLEPMEIEEMMIPYLYYGDIDDAAAATMDLEDNDLYSNTDWVERKLERRIEDFADLNEGEMSFLKLWNRHLRSLQGVGVTHMPAVVQRFVEMHGMELLEQNLYRNFVAHLTTFQQLNIVGAETFLSAMSQLQRKMTGMVAMPDLESSWQNMFSQGLLKEPEEEGGQTSPEMFSSSGGQARDENSNTGEEKNPNKGLTSRSTFLMNQFLTQRIARAGKTLKEFEEGMARTARIVKEGHLANHKEKRTWTKIKVI